MAKYLLLLLVIMVVAWGLFGRRRVSRREGSSPAGGPASSGAAARQIDDMVSCAHCGVHLPRGEALAEEARGGARHYCGPEHRRLGPGPSSGS